MQIQLKSGWYSTVSIHSASLGTEDRREAVRGRVSRTECGECRADGRMVANWGRPKLKCLETGKGYLNPSADSQKLEKVE